MSNALDEAERRVSYYRRNRDQAEDDLKQAQGALRLATLALEIAQKGLDAAEDVYAAAARGIARAPRQIKADTRALLLGLIDRKLEIVGASEIAKMAEELGLNFKPDALRQWLKRIADDGFLLRVDRGTYRLNREMTAALADGAQEVDRASSAHPVEPDPELAALDGDQGDTVNAQHGEAVSDLSGQGQLEAGVENPGSSESEEANLPDDKSEGDTDRVNGTRTTQFDHDYLKDDTPF